MRPFLKIVFSKAFKISVLLSAALLIIHPCFAEDEGIVDTKTTKNIQLIKGELETLRVYSLTRVSIIDPNVADIINADDEEVLIIGKSSGQTVFFLWDDLGKRTINISVVTKDLQQIKSRLERLFEAVEISGIDMEINEAEAKLVLKGNIPSDKSTDFENIISPFAEDIMLLAKESKEDDLIQIDVQITELNTTLQKEFGVNWGTNLSDDFAFSFTETAPATPTGGIELRDIFKIGDFSQRQENLVATVNAILERGEGRVLSKPKLVVVSGESASFNVGGEVPVRTTSATSAGFVENVSFKSFGISMSITPEIQKVGEDRKVDVDLNVTVSDVDASLAVGDDVGFSNRTASTKLFLDDGQTIVLAGLIKHNDSELVSKVPFLGDVPVLGLLFRNRATPVADVDQELVISLTPTILTNHEKDGDAPMEMADAMGEDMMHKEMMDEHTMTMEDVVEETEQMHMEEAKGSAYEHKGSMSKDHKDVEAKSKGSMGMESMRYGRAPKEMAEYIQDVQRKISQSIEYPSEAEEFGWEGTVKVGLHILNDGTLAFALVKESSGYEIFDEYALNIAKNVAPYESFPSNTDLRELSVTIPIVYSLKKN